MVETFKRAARAICVSACKIGSGAKLMHRSAQITRRREDGL